MIIFWLITGILAHGLFHAYQMRDEPYPYCPNWRYYNDENAYKLWAFSLVFNVAFGPLALIAVLGGDAASHGLLFLPNDYK
jgi:hypothetical protein